jgi:hypothetical protein
MTLISSSSIINWRFYKRGLAENAVTKNLSFQVELDRIMVIFANLDFIKILDIM